MGMACNNVTLRSDCCKYLDNRSEQASIYHGQPCVALRRSLKGLPSFLNKDESSGSDDGLCQPANYVAATAPGRAMDCSALLTSSSSSLTDGQLKNDSNGAVWEDNLDQYLQDLEDEMTLEDEPIAAMARTDLPEGQTCQIILDPLLCCAARSIENGTAGDGTGNSSSTQNECVPVKPSPLVNNAGNSSWSASSIERQSVSLSCLPRQGQPNDNQLNNTTTNTKVQGEVSEVAAPDDDEDYSCEGIVQAARKRRTQLSITAGDDGNCAALQSPRSCCSAMDAQGQPCWPLRTSENGGGIACASISWIVAHLSFTSNVTVMECSK